jgi:hypothetical protein
MGSASIVLATSRMLQDGSSAAHNKLIPVVAVIRLEDSHRMSGTAIARPPLRLSRRCAAPLF